MRLTRYRLTSPLLALLALVLIGACSLVFYGAAKIDEDAIQREEWLVKRNLVIWINELEKELEPFVASNRTMAEIIDGDGGAWLESHLVQAIFRTTASRFVAVVEGDGRLRLARSRDANTTGDLLRRQRDAIVRMGEELTRGARIFEVSRTDGFEPQKLSESRIVLLDGTAVLVIATLFQYETRTIVPPGFKAPMLITAVPIENGIVDAFSSRFSLRDALLQSSPATSEPVKANPRLAEARIASDPKADISLVWVPFRPGQTMLSRVMPLMIASVLAFLVGAAIFLNVIRRSTNALLASEEQLRHAAAHDVLTGLRNRRTFEETLAALAERGPLTVACFDLDSFKPINDRYGHAAGDCVLKAVGDRLRRATGMQDECFRLGGDEFALLLPGIVGERARVLCQAIVGIVSQPIALPRDGQVRVGASIGLATVDGSASVETALLRADAALYRAKGQRPGKPVDHPGEAAGKAA